MNAGIAQKLLDAASEVDSVATTPKVFRLLGFADTTHLVEWGDGTSGGVVEVESADHENYAGTWNPEATITFAGTAPKVDSVFVLGPRRAFRHRISGPVGDGTVTTKIVGRL